MFVFNRNEQDVSLITIDYYTIPVILFIFYTTGIFLVEQNEIEW